MIIVQNACGAVFFAAPHVYNSNLILLRLLFSNRVTRNPATLSQELRDRFQKKRLRKKCRGTSNEQCTEGELSAGEKKLAVVVKLQARFAAREDLVFVVRILGLSNSCDNSRQAFVACGSPHVAFVHKRWV